MAITTQERTNIIKLTVGLFNAAPGANYLAEFTSVYEAGGHSLAALASTLNSNGTFTNLYPNFLTGKEFATKFLSTLNLQNNQEAMDYVVAKYNAGVPKTQIILDALVAIDATTSPAFAEAQAILVNKAAVAENYSVTLNASSESLAALQGAVANVTANPASVTAANAANAGASGQTFTLTTALGEQVNGTAGNDAFNAVLSATVGSSTLNVGDMIDGKGGNDTLKLFVDTAAVALPAGLQVNNVENIQITNGGSLSAAIDASAFVGATTIKQINTSKAVEKVAATTTASYSSLDQAGVGVNAGLIDVTADATAASVSIALDKVKGAANDNVVAAAVKADAANTALAAVNVAGNIIQKDTTAAAAATKTVFAATVAGTEVGSDTTVAFDGQTITLSAGAGAALATDFATKYNAIVAAHWVAVASGTTITFTAKVAGVAAAPAFSVGGNVAADTSVTFTGTAPTVVGAAPVAAAAAASLALNAVLGKDVQAATVNTSVKTTLTIENAAGSTKNLTSVDASASAGDITYTSADAQVATIKTGAGKDVVEIRTATSNVAGAVVDAMVDTGAGDDKVTVLTTGTGKTTVNAGAGNDSILIGALGAGSLKTSTIIDGGEGMDTLSLAGKTLVAEDYVLFNSVVKNVEAVEFTTGPAVVDASKLAFTAYTFAGNAGDTVTEASAAALTTKGALTAVSTGYKADNKAAVDADFLTDAYGGALNITSAVGTSAAVKAFGSNVNLNVKASVAADTSVVLTGDAQTATVALTNSGSVVAGDKLASVSIVTAAAPAADGTAVLGNSYLTSLTLSGNGSAVVDSSLSTKLATIDASALGGTLAFGATAGNVTGGLNFTGSAAVAETIKLGSGKDVLTIASTFDKMDTIVGFDAKKETADLMKSVTDTIIFGSATLDGSAAGQATKVVLSVGATSLDLAFVEAAAANDGTGVSFFQFGGDTYLFKDAAVVGSTPGLDATDMAVKIVGAVDFAAAWGNFVA